MRIAITVISAFSLVLLLACQSGMATKPQDYSFVLADSNVTALCNAALKQTSKKVTYWDVAAGHVGIVVNERCPSDTSRCMIVHNIGSGPKLVDFLFGAKILGHYRYNPWQKM